MEGSHWGFSYLFLSLSSQTCPRGYGLQWQSNWLVMSLCDISSTWLTTAACCYLLWMLSLQPQARAVEMAQWVMILAMQAWQPEPRFPRESWAQECMAVISAPFWREWGWRQESPQVKGQASLEYTAQWWTRDTGRRQRQMPEEVLRPLHKCCGTHRLPHTNVCTRYTHTYIKVNKYQNYKHCRKTKVSACPELGTIGFCHWDCENCRSPYSKKKRKEKKGGGWD